MNVMTLAVAIYLVGAGLGFGLPADRIPGSPEMEVIDCDGCTPTGGLRVYTWRNLGGGPTDMGWDEVGGTLTYTHDTGDEVSDTGSCIPDGEATCKPDDPCKKTMHYTITGGGLLNRFSHLSSGCRTFANLTAAERTLTVTANKCDGAEQQDIFYAYSSVSCAGPSANDEKWVAWAKCSLCVAK